MTEFPICRLKARPQFDTLPVMKITLYPLEPRDYKPFAQGLLAVDPQRLYVRLWAFETPPEPESRIICVLRSDRELIVRAGPEQLELLLDGEPTEALLAHPFTGEDLQGKYWGWLAELPADLLGELTPGRTLRGNLYKLSDGKRPHTGSFYPMEKPEDPLSRDNDGSFAVCDF